MVQIEIVDPKEAWREDFREIAGRLRDALEDLAPRIDQIGSISVEGLPAKDVIVIQATVSEMNRDVIEAALRPAGYALREEVTRDHVPPGANPAVEEWRKLYFRAPAGQRPTHLHVRQAGRANQRYAILFRDYLRGHPDAAATYAQIKLALARLHPNDKDAYYDVKDPACDLIMLAAEAWASQVQWEPGETDA